MSAYMIVALAVGALLPIVVAVGVVLFARARGALDMPLAIAFGKGILYGALGGAAVSAVVVSVALGVVALRDR